jgi:hypothetical protein
MRRRPSPHTTRYARDHRCNHADIRLRLAVADTDPAGRRQLLTLLGELPALLTRVGLAARAAPRRAG